MDFIHKFKFAVINLLVSTRMDNRAVVKPTEVKKKSQSFFNAHVKQLLRFLALSWIISYFTPRMTTEGGFLPVLHNNINYQCEFCF
jgi:hypothetical protein